MKDVEISETKSNESDDSCGRGDIEIKSYQKQEESSREEWLHTEESEALRKLSIDGSDMKLAEDGGLKETLAGLAGNVLEWYDFAVFGYFSDIIGKVFFPPQEGNASIVQSFAVFGGAFIMRPFGGLLMGYIGDKFGRKRALEISIFLMAFPTFAMGCLPSYEAVGWLAIVLLTLVRLLQGLSVGGQLVSSLVFTLEKHDKHKWGLYGSFVLGTANVGTLLGGIMGAIMRSTLSDEQLEAWGWRVPFLMGILVSASGFYLKHHCSEVQIPHKNVQNPIKEAFSKDNRRSLLSASFVPMLWSCGFYLSFVWMAIYMQDLVATRVPNAFLLNSFALFFTNCLFFPVAGSLSDKYGRVNVMTFGALGIIWLGPLTLYVVNTAQPMVVFITQSSLGICLACWGAPMCAWLVEQFPPEVRLTAVAIGYNIAQAVMGGLGPAVATIMVSNVGIMSPGIIYVVVAIVALIGLYIAPPKLDDLYLEESVSTRDDNDTLPQIT